MNLNLNQNRQFSPRFSLQLATTKMIITVKCKQSVVVDYAVHPKQTLLCVTGFLQFFCSTTVSKEKNKATSAPLDSNLLPIISNSFLYSSLKALNTAYNTIIKCYVRYSTSSKMRTIEHI